MEINMDSLSGMVDQLQSALGQAHKQTTQELWGNLMEESPVDQGRLAGSWVMRSLGHLHSSVGTSVTYALIVNDGFDPFTIEARNGGALSWSGASHPVKKVEHPGFAGDAYIDRAVTGASGRGEEFITSALKGAGLL